MSVAAPTSMTVTGGASVTLSFSAWSTSGGAVAVWAAILATSFTGLSTTYHFRDFFDNAPTLIADIAATATVSMKVAEDLFRQLYYIVSMYLFQALESSGVPFSIALA